MYIHPAMYIRPRFLWPNVVYMKSVVDCCQFSVCRTLSAAFHFHVCWIHIHHCGKQRSHRMPTLRQLWQGRENQAEPAVRYWQHSSSFESYSMFNLPRAVRVDELGFWRFLATKTQLPIYNKAPSEDCIRIPSQHKDTPEFLLDFWS